MAHFAEIDKNNKVIRVLVTDNNDSAGDEGYQWLIDNLGGHWVKTSYNTFGGKHTQNGIPLHKNYAGIGYTFDGVGFYAPQPYLSWKLNNETYLWEPPIEMPKDGNIYYWDEQYQNWILKNEA